MFVSPRFRDIFSPRPLRTRASDKAVAQEDSQRAADPRQGPVDAESIWLEITAAHRRAARSFTPEFIRREDLAGDDRSR